MWEIDERSGIMAVIQTGRDDGYPGLHRDLPWVLLAWSGMFNGRCWRMPQRRRRAAMTALRRLRAGEPHAVVCADYPWAHNPSFAVRKEQP